LRREQEEELRRRKLGFNKENPWSQEKEEEYKKKVTIVKLSLFVLFLAWVPRMAWYEITKEDMPMLWTALCLPLSVLVWYWQQWC
jgi:hypothetical protein